MHGPLILAYRNILPRIDPTAFIAPGVVITGDVEIGAHANIWFNVVIRGDDAPVRIGARANIQDGCVLHVTFDGTERIPCVVGDAAAVGHMALLHGCRLEPGAFVGMRATVMDRAIVESGAMVAAGALVAPRKLVKSGELWSGTPARFARMLKPEERDYMAGCRSTIASWRTNTGLGASGGTLRQTEVAEIQISATSLGLGDAQTGTYVNPDLVNRASLG